VFREILTEPQQALLELLSRVAEVRTFYLAGGTALALYLGHRRSRDFDFFRASDFAPQDLLRAMHETGDLEVLQATAGTLTVSLRGVPTSFFHYDYPLLRPLRESAWGLWLADPDDIAAMKIAAVAGRGSRKDFVDLYFFAREIAPLEHALRQFRDKYHSMRMDPYHLLRSLTFFEDAEAEAMPDLLAGVSWDEIKTFFRVQASRLFRDL
jgi:Nucleotidyl transferase AbiEii toxin, Type IV TA system